ncbi:MAG: NADH-quinone oxidoreductase subunit NuoK [Thermotogae bacterium]|nr:NADH-quinone oxidoreductase subunit NuoK [Thermotogota bacterium]
MNPTLVIGVSLIIFSIGLFGVLFRRNFLVVLMSLELMLNSANLTVIAASQTLGPEGIQGHFLALMLLIVAAVEVAIGLAIAVHMYRQSNSVDTDAFSQLPK